MSYLAWIILGALAAAVARVGMPGRSDVRGTIVMIVIGVIGAVIGGFLGQTLMGRAVTGINWPSLLLAILGALLLLWIYRRTTRGPTSSV